MLTNNQLAVLMPIVDTLVSFTTAFLTYRYLQYKNEQMIKKNNPTKDNGHNLDYSFRIDGGEVVGLHLRGTTAQDLLDKTLKVVFGNVDDIKGYKYDKKKTD